jgi:nicotinate-nucleotide--dimethylbenzimidazole phosphoribosyltransferase
MIALDYLGLKALLKLGMRLGEGSGAAVAMLLIEAATAALDEMATFDEAGVSE